MRDYVEDRSESFQIVFLCKLLLQKKYSFLKNYFFWKKKKISHSSSPFLPPLPLTSICLLMRSKNKDGLKTRKILDKSLRSYHVKLGSRWWELMKVYLPSGGLLEKNQDVSVWTSSRRRARSNIVHQNGRRRNIQVRRLERNTRQFLVREAGARNISHCVQTPTGKRMWLRGF